MDGVDTWCAQDVVIVIVIEVNIALFLLINSCSYCRDSSRIRSIIYVDGIIYISSVSIVCIVVDIVVVATGYHVPTTVVNFTSCCCCIIILSAW